MIASMITQKRLKETLVYCPETGVFTWRERIAKPNQNAAKVASWNTRYAGKEAGVKTHGYIKIAIDDKKYYAHRLAWLYVYGAIPPLLDHINRNGEDNRIQNLRQATKRMNVDNSTRKDNTTGFRGVTKSANGKKFIAQRLSVKGKSRYLGTFDTAEELMPHTLPRCDA